MTSLTSHCRVDEVSLVVTSVGAHRNPPFKQHVLYPSDYLIEKNAPFVLFDTLFGTLFLYLSDISPSAPSDHLSLVTALTHSADSVSTEHDIIFPSAPDLLLPLNLARP